LKQFKVVYKEGEIKKGRNLLAFEVAKRNVFNFLKVELESIKAGDAIRLLLWSKHLNEVASEFAVSSFNKGNVDRIEERNGNGLSIIRRVRLKKSKCNA
jgi:hypothetical protein